MSAPTCPHRLVRSLLCVAALFAAGTVRAVELTDEPDVVTALTRGTTSAVSVSPSDLLPAKEGESSSTLLPQRMSPGADWQQAMDTLHRLRRGPIAEAPIGQANLLPRATLDSGFGGITQTGAIPPDPYIGVGPSHVVTVVNTVYRVYDRNGAALTPTIPLTGAVGGLFNGTGATSSVTDPKCLYDQHSGRFVIMILEIVNGSQRAYVLLAVSKTANPVTGGWWTYRSEITTSISGSNHWGDYPGLGVDADAIYVTANMFSFTTGLFGGSKLRYFAKAPLLIGSPATFFDDLTNTSLFTVQPAHTHGTAIAEYFATHLSPGSVRLSAVRNSTTAPVRTNTTVVVGGSYSDPATDVPNLGGSNLDGFDGRMHNAFWRNNRLLCTHIQSTGGKDIVRWYEFDTGNWPISGLPTLVQSGVIDAGGDIHTWFPSIASNNCGQIAMVFGRSASTERASVQFTGRESTDAPGSMQAMTQAIVGTSGYNQFRWGDYFHVVVDPVDDQAFWGIGEYATGTNFWRTFIFKFTVASCCQAPVINAIADAGAFCGVNYDSPPPTASGSTPITWSLGGSPPAGMVIDAGSGIVSWPNPIPSPTPYTVTVNATNSCGMDSEIYMLSIHPGDFTGDGQVMTDDIPSFVDHLLRLDTTLDCAADVNLDTDIDGLDIEEFLIYLL